MGYQSLMTTFATLCTAMSMQALTVTGLHTQHLTDPVGIDVQEPLFSWVLESDRRGVMQQSYQIVVATDPGMGNVVWDSGVVESSVSTGVKAVGFTPSPSTRYYWAVTVRSNQGESATSSQTSYFETGLMDSGWSGAKWIRKGDIKGGDSTPSVDPSTIKDYTVEADFEIERVAAGIIWGAVDHNNYYMWQFNTERNPPMFRPHRWHNGGASCLEELQVDLKNETPYHMKIEVSENGTVARTYINDQLIDTRTGSFPYGSMGVRSAMAEYYTRYYETSYYDDFKVTSDGKVLYEDTFDNRDNYDNGKIVGGKLRTSGDYIAWQQNFTPDSSVKNYTVEGKFTIDQVAAGICFAGVDNSHFYMWQFNLEGDKPLFRPHRWNGGAACLAEISLENAGGLKQGQEYEFRIEVTDDGATARTYLDNQLIDTRSGEFVYGRLGIRCALGEKNTRTYERSFYDNFKTTAADGTVLYEDDFNNPDFMTLSQGDAIDGRLRVGAYSDVYAWAIDASAIDPDLHYVIEADMTLVRDNASIIFSRTGSTNFHMWALNTADNATPRIRRHVYSGGGSPDWSDTELKGMTKDDFLNKERHLKIEVQRNIIYTYIDGQKVDTYKDNSGTLALGLIGFRSNNGANENEQAYWDNIKVTVLNPDGTSYVRMNEDFEGDTNEFDDAELVTVDGDTKLYMLSRNGETRILENSANGAPMFRKEFSIDGPVRSAKLYTTALGNYTMFINGQRVGHLQNDGSMIYDEFMPGWTEYRKKVFYNTHDVTSLVKEGENAIGAQLSNGWWAGDIAHGVYGSPDMAFMGKLVVELESGEIVTVVSDESWTTASNGAVKRGDIYHGETYDARALDAWTSAGYNGTDWNAAAVDGQFQGQITAFEGPAVRIRRELERAPQSVTIYDGVKATGTQYGEINVTETRSQWSPVTLKKGETMIVDFGQNFVGWVKLNVKGESGATVKMRFAEMLNDKGDVSRGDDGPGGSVYTINLRNAKCLLNYVLAGDAEGETYSPTTSFYGFRYCEVKATRDVTINSIVGEVVGSEIEEGSSLTVDHDAVNQLYSNVIWGQRSNFLSVPTDCPQRDERLGWTADTQIFSLAASYNSNTLAFYHKWMGDMRDSQREDGAYPDVAPYCWVGFGQAAWGDAGVILPWNVYSMYGDRSIIEENYESMERYMDYVAAQAGDGYKYNGAGTSYGDWVSFAYTDSRYVSVAYYGYMADLMSRMSKVMSETEGDVYDLKAAEYAELFDAIRAEFNKRYVLSTGVPKISTQTAMLLALRFNLLTSEKSVTATKNRLRALIASNGNKLSTGFVGTGIINQTLSEYGMDDLAYTLLLQRECPSWLYSVDQGATTIWERWDSYTKERGFHSDITMNSFNHYAYGAVAEWMYRYMAGIAPDKDNAGFSHFVLNPTPDNRTDLKGQQRITTVDATYASNSGKIRSAWTRQDDGTIDYNVTVPANTTATLYFPVSSDEDPIMEGDTAAADAEGVESLGVENGKARFNLGSGSYTFRIGVPSGVESVKERVGEISVLPNPTVGPVTVECEAEVVRILVHDIAGSCVVNATDTRTVDLSAFPAGLYILSATTADGLTSVAKIIKR